MLFLSIGFPRVAAKTSPFDTSVLLLYLAFSTVFCYTAYCPKRKCSANTVTNCKENKKQKGITHEKGKGAEKSALFLCQNVPFLILRCIYRQKKMPSLSPKQVVALVELYIYRLVESADRDVYCPLLRIFFCCSVLCGIFFSVDQVYAEIRAKRF